MSLARDYGCLETSLARAGRGRFRFKLSSHFRNVLPGEMHRCSLRGATVVVVQIQRVGDPTVVVIIGSQTFDPRVAGVTLSMDGGLQC